MKEKKKFPTKCRTKRCRGVVVSKRCHSPYCPKCKWKQWTAVNPLRAAFKTLRNHAKERGKEFTLTLAEFKAFAEKTSYMDRKGKTSLSLSIDRKDNTKGYSADNIQALTLMENSRKQFVPYFAQHMRDTMADTQSAIAAAYPGL